MSDYYTVGSPESLTHKTVDDAVEDYISNYISNILASEPIPDEIVVEGYSQVPLTKDCGQFVWAFDKLFEDLDEELDPKGAYENRLNKEIIEAYDRFVRTVVSEYNVWSYDQDETITVNIKKWRDVELKEK